MTLEEAKRIAKHLAKGREIAGPFFDAPYTAAQLVDVVVTLDANTGNVSEAEATKLRRQLAASEARNGLMKQKRGIKDED